MMAFLLCLLFFVFLYPRLRCVFASDDPLTSRSFSPAFAWRSEEIMSSASFSGSVNMTLVVRGATASNIIFSLGVGSRSGRCLPLPFFQYGNDGAACQVCGACCCSTWCLGGREAQPLAGNDAGAG